MMLCSLKFCQLLEPPPLSTKPLIAISENSGNLLSMVTSLLNKSFQIKGSVYGLALTWIYIRLRLQVRFSANLEQHARQLKGTHKFGQ